MKRQHPSQRKILKVQYLSNHRSDLTQIWSLLWGEYIQLYKASNEDNLKWLKVDHTSNKSKVMPRYLHNLTKSFGASMCEAILDVKHTDLKIINQKLLLKNNNQPTKYLQNKYMLWSFSDLYHPILNHTSKKWSEFDLNTLLSKTLASLVYSQTFFLQRYYIEWSTEKNDWWFKMGKNMMFYACLQHVFCQ